ncbi:hypothetical protein [Aquirhabdus parva]|uniref:Uncharacterized protein n=1 Tax=Aquirhabdus parva TaxID=2283318 RepID=A0A345P9B8_9GAMM|nr:hypothetical protein [Aquirhabdus parva]AXI03877.1 hypothetical protein HYN46_14140 [Aquirhabdus parva]
MSQFISFVCPSCQAAQFSRMSLPLSSLYLSGSMCDHCGQIISTETKCQQVDDLSFAQDSHLNSMPDVVEAAISIKSLMH